MIDPRNGIRGNIIDSLLMGRQVAPVLFRDIRFNSAEIKDAAQLKQSGVDLAFPAKFEP